MKRLLIPVFILMLFASKQIKSQEIFVYNESNSPVIVDDMYSLAIDSSNNILVGGTFGAIDFDHESWTIFDTLLNILPPFNYSQYISDIEVSPNGNIWLAVFNWQQSEPNNLYKIVGDEVTGYSFGYIGLRNSYKLSVENDSTIVIVFLNFWQQGSSYLDAIGFKKGNDFNFIGEFWELKSASLLNNDSTIIATIESKLFLYENNVWSDITPENWGEYERFFIYKFNDEIYFYGDRLIKYAGGVFFEYSEINSILEADSSKITSIKAESANRFWLGTDTGLLIKYDDTNITLFNEITGFEIIELAIDKDKNIWLIADGLGCVIFNEDQIVAVEQSEQIVPDDFELFQNYPNPFNPTTKIKFAIPAEVKGEMSKVQLKIYDILGNEIATLVDEQKPHSTYEVEFDGKGLSSGIYFYKLSVGKFSETKKMLLMK